MLIVMQIIVQSQLRGEYLVLFSPLIVHYFVDLSRLLPHHFGCPKIQNGYIKRLKRELGTKPSLCIYVGTDTSATAVAHILAMMTQTIFGVKQRCCPIVVGITLLTTILRCVFFFSVYHNISEFLFYHLQQSTDFSGMSSTIIHDKGDVRNKHHDAPRQALCCGFIIANATKNVCCPRNIEGHSDVR